MKKHGISIFIGVASILLTSVPVFAHVIVYPHQTGIAQTQDFTVSVPNERDNPVVSVRLLIPKGLSEVSPNTTQGWTILIKSKGSGDNTVVSEIDWSNGSIPVGQREEFIFQAQVPTEPTTLAWKAYQTYSDGTVVSWDVDPAKMSKLSDAQQDALADKENKGEYSTTQVINDLAVSNVTNASENSNIQVIELFSGLAFLISVVALAISLKKKR
jgi:uncharacterized protein YcnI